MFSLQQFMVGYVIYYLNPMYLMFLACYFFDYKYYYILEDKETTQYIMKRLNGHILSSCTKFSKGKEITSGYFCGWKCIGYMDNSTYEDTKIHIITKSVFYDYLIKHNEQYEAPVIIPHQEISRLEVFIRKGTYKNFYYTCLRLDISHINPIGDQSYIISDIIDIYKQNGRATVFIDGVSYAGKSSIGYIVAKQLGGKYCHSFNPSDPGDQLSTLTSDVSIEDAPLVIVLEEVDVMIQNIHADTLKPNREIPTSVHNKTTWSSFLDDMIFYKRVIMIMTSNTLKSELDKLDPSYLRKGRIHEAYSMPNQLIIETRLED